jgi:hypothetical protein
MIVAISIVVAGCGSSSNQSEYGKGLTAADVVQQLKAAGLPIGKVTTYSPATDPSFQLGRPGQYTSKANFRDTRVENRTDPADVSAGGSVEVYASRDDASKRADFLRSVTGGGATSGEYDYLRGRVFLQVSKKLTPAQAKTYDRALEEAQ